MLMTLRPLADAKGELHRLFDEMDRMFEPFAPQWRVSGERNALSGVFPAINVFQKENALVVQAAVAGYAPSDVKVEVENATLIISGHRETKREESGEALRREIVESDFCRKIALPSDIRVEEASAAFQDGVLTIRLPLATTPARAQIAIQQ